MSSLLSQMVFQLDNLNMILPDWTERWTTTTHEAHNTAWITAIDPLLMLRVLRILNHPTILSERLLHTTACQRAFRMGIPKYYVIREECPLLPTLPELEAAWTQRGSLIHRIL